MRFPEGDINRIGNSRGSVLREGEGGARGTRSLPRALRALLLLAFVGAGCSELPASWTGKVPNDLLKLMDMDKDLVKGKWTKDDSGLHTTTTSFGRVQIPYIPGDEYDVKLVCQRSGGVDMIAVGLVKGNNQFVIGIDGTTKFTASGLDRFDGKAFTDNETTVKKTALDNAKASTILIQVRNDSFVVTVDGNGLIEWKIKDKDGKDTGKPLDYSKLTLFPDWKVPLGKAMFLGAFSDYTVTTLELTNQTTGGKFLR